MDFGSGLRPAIWGQGCQTACQRLDSRLQYSSAEIDDRFPVISGSGRLHLARSMLCPFQHRTGAAVIL